MLLERENCLGKLGNVFMCRIDIDQSHNAAQAIPQTIDLFDCFRNVGIRNEGMSGFKLFKDVHAYCPLL